MRVPRNPPIAATGPLRVTRSVVEEDGFRDVRADLPQRPRFQGSSQVHSRIISSPGDPVEGRPVLQTVDPGAYPPPDGERAAIAARWFGLFRLTQVGNLCQSIPGLSNPRTNHVLRLKL
jgi:hypothetical protein